MKIVFEGVTKKFGSIAALEDVSFKIKPGEFVFLVGESGAGKTTLLRLILGQFMPTAGNIIVGDLSLDKAKKKQIIRLRRQIGMAFQDFCLIRDKTAKENIMMALDILGLPKEEKEARLEKALGDTGIGEREHFFPSQLSGGELQRCCIARALAVKPKLILADEPTGNLDPETSWQLIEILKKENKKGTTVLMATHNFDIVDSLRERVLYLKRGKLLKDKKGGKYRLK